MGLNSLFDKLPLNNYIVLESIPVYSDNAKAVYEELLRREYNKKYKIFWLNYNGECTKSTFGNIKNVCLLENSPKGNKVKQLLNRLKTSFVLHTAKVFVSGNNFFSKFRDEQINIHLTHGAALKNCSGHYTLPKDVDVALTFSDYIAKYDAINYMCDESKLIPLGYPRNDELFGEKISIDGLFPNAKYNKIIYWMPTFRQHKNGKVTSSSIAFPIIYNQEIAQRINEYAVEKKVLLIVKPHFAQDVSKMTEMHLSNLEFINNEFLRKNGIANYALLRSADAMITDYSSVYYDYLLCDKPIGLCFDDYEEFNAQNGFTVDPDYIFSGGEKIYNTDDLLDFINNISNESDCLKEQRNEIKNVVFKHCDNQSTKRVVDYIETRLK